MDDFLSRRASAWRWSAAVVFGLVLHGAGLWALMSRNQETAAVAAPESVVIIDLPPAPELPPLESVEQTAVEEVPTNDAPEMVETPVDVPDVAASLPPPETLAETLPPEPEMLPPSEVAIPLPLEQPPKMVETQEVKPKELKPKKPEPIKVAKPKPPTPPADAQLAGAGAGRATEDELAAYRSSVRRAILSRRRASDADGAVGRAVVQISIARDGSIMALSVSGSTTVGAAAEQLIRRVGSFPAVPTTLQAPFSVTVPIDFVQE